MHGNITSTEFKNKKNACLKVKIQKKFKSIWIKNECLKRNTWTSFKSPTSFFKNMTLMKRKWNWK